MPATLITTNKHGRKSKYGQTSKHDRRQCCNLASEFSNKHIIASKVTDANVIKPGKGQDRQYKNE